MEMVGELVELGIKVRMGDFSKRDKISKYRWISFCKLYVGLDFVQLDTHVC